MPRLPTVNTTEMNIVVSGHKRMEAQARKALTAAGFTVIASDDKRHRQDDWGHPSYTDPVIAKAAGKPNSGHTPGTQHPSTLRYLVLPGDHAETCGDGCEHEGHTEVRPWDSKHIGEWYERDQRIAFVGMTIECGQEPEARSAAVSKAHDAVAPLGWQLRAHHETQPAPEKPSLEERLRQAGIEIPELRALLAKGA